MTSFASIILNVLRKSIIQNSESKAFYISDKYYSYRQFSERISAIRTIISDCQSNQQVFAIVIHDDLDTYASIIALWMEGKAYVPLHPRQPLERNLSIIDQVGIDCILDSAEQSLFSNEGRYIIKTVQCEYEKDYLDNWTCVSDCSLAYILFTSGSTGVPKGVPLSRKNLSSFISSFWRLGYDVNNQDGFLQCFDLTFDLSIISFLIPLLRGACVYTVPYNVTKFLYIISLFTKCDITFALMTPSTLLYLKPFFGELFFPNVKYSLFCGEALPTEIALAWSRCIPNAVVDNVYGPTENTIFCTSYRLKMDNNVDYNGILSIGKPMPGTEIKIIDENNKEVGEGVIGELCLSGDQLTKGYWNNPVKNSESFWNTPEGARFYRSGDLCFYDKNGDILFVGRKDSQVKVHGYRIELSEIEFHVRAFYQNKYNVVSMTFSNQSGQTEIALFIEAVYQDSSDLLSYLQGKIPSYMLPTRILFEPSFPLNNSNKIDRNKLKQQLNQY
jgi:amino acid adenylation domain-containing protein